VGGGHGTPSDTREESQNTFALGGVPVPTLWPRGWSALDLLRELDGSIDGRPRDRFLDDGDVVTSAGVSAGIDMALHLVARLAGLPRARDVQRSIQYEPSPL